ncbi:MAG: RagB/SusD family nutrient uptake outer membrane protein [Bacteroidia bacterium]|nr:RagB/SusD family nutrient uptake outer membrane protein [Bacteroidia bacterium]
MNLSNIKYAVAASALLFGATSCEDFLDRPGEDSYNTSTYYQTNDQLHSTSATIYNSPWYDFQRGFLDIGEVMSGNMNKTCAYQTFTVNGTDENLVNMSASLWSVNAYCNTLIKNVDELAGPATTEVVRKEVKGEALVWKAMAYFYLVRNFGGVPIIHNNTDMLASGNYNSVYRATKANVYQYIVNCLEKAIEWLPSKPSTAGRIDQYSAKGLLAKVYLAKAGVTGTLNKEDLQKAVEYATDVKNNSGRTLQPNYFELFRPLYNTCPESLIAWRWTVGADWTSQNSFQSDLAIGGFNEIGDIWGGWAGPSVDLIEAFGDSPLSASRMNADTRRKATCMMAGDVYEYFWEDYASTFSKGGFEMLDFVFNDDADVIASRNKMTGQGQTGINTGAQSVKHLVGDAFDHKDGTWGCGIAYDRMASALATHLLRLADVYLILAEAQALIDGKTTTNAEALDAFNKVHMRACPGAKEVESLTWAEVWKERRLELAYEGDRWYDFVRLAYYDEAAARAELASQKRGTIYGITDALKTYFKSGYQNWDVSNCGYDDKVDKSIDFNTISFELPFPDTDKLTNPHLSEEPVDQEVPSYN